MPGESRHVAAASAQTSVSSPVKWEPFLLTSHQWALLGKASPLGRLLLAALWAVPTGAYFLQ